MKKYLVLVLVLFLVGCSASTPESPVSVDTPESPVSVDVPEVPGSSDVSEVPSVSSDSVLSDLRCVDSRINGVITNTNGVSLEIARDIKVIVNGLNVVDPVCDKLIIQPDESVFCDDLSGHYAIRPGQTNTVKLNFLRNSVIEVVECPE